MSARAYDAIVVGAGHNGLVTAAYLAGGGLRTLVLERRARPGGALATTALGSARVPALAHTVGRLRRSVIEDLGLGRHGLSLIRPAARVFAPSPEGPGLTLWDDPARTAEELRSRSAADAEAYPAFDRRVRAIASFLAYVGVTTPPDLRAPSLSDAVAGLGLGRAFRGLGRGPRREALRILPMAVADLVEEAFSSDLLRGAIAARAVQHAALGPRSAGTAATLLMDSAGNDGGAAGQTVYARGGPGALAEALAAAVRAAGAEIRTGAEVAAIASRDGAVTGVTLGSGEELRAPVVASTADPKRTLLGLLDPVEVGPTLAWRAGNIRMPGVSAKVNLVLDGLPSFAGAVEGEGARERLKGRIVLAPSVDYLERAFDASKYGAISERPFLEGTIPTLVDPSLAPEGTHVMSVLFQWAPYHRREGDWDADRDRLGDLALAALEGVAPGLSARVVEREVLTPLDLERDYGLTEGHALHGEPALDQFFAWRPLLGLARYRGPVAGLYLCGSGAHPGGGVTGGPGANAAREILSDWSKRRRRS